MAEKYHSRKIPHISRRAFLKTSVLGSVSLLAAACQSRPKVVSPQPETVSGNTEKQSGVVSIVKIKTGDIEAAVEEAIYLLGGIEAVTKGKESIMLKPNLVSDDSRATTKPEVIHSLAKMMKAAGKDVFIGEGSAAAGGFNARGNSVYRTKDADILNGMQQMIFDRLGYTELAQSLDIPLINLHTGEMVDVDVPNGFAYQKLTLHHTLTEIDLLCSVPMMKTHTLATVTLGMKNLIGLYPGSVYRTVRAGVHDHAADAGSPGVAYEIIDVVRANKLGLVVIDGSTAMEGDGPSDGILVPMDIIIAGTNPLATDMVAANVMGFERTDIPTFIWANKAGMQPHSIKEIEIRGSAISDVKRPFVKPNLYAWNDIRHVWGAENLP